MYVIVKGYGNNKRFFDEFGRRYVIQIDNATEYPTAGEATRVMKAVGLKYCYVVSKVSVVP